MSSRSARRRAATEPPPLADALAAEHAAVYAFGPIGARLSGDEADLARATEAAHRDRRDALVLWLAGLGVEPPPAAVSYALPFEVTDAGTARRLAAQIEESAAGVWRVTVARTATEDREFALTALIECALQAARWRRLAGLNPVTRVFPGLF